MIPRDDFTPHGYLDNPFHSWKLNPSGVLRSRPPLGMGWHVPNLGSYVRNQFQYSAHLNIGLRLGDDLLLITPEDFQRQGCALNSPLHTRNRFAYNCIVPSHNLLVHAVYFLVEEHVLGCLLSLTATGESRLRVTCYVQHEHTHNPFTSRLWEHGLYGRALPGGNLAMLGIASEGDVFIHGWLAVDDGPAPQPGEPIYTVSQAELGARLRGAAVAPPTVTQADPETGWQVRTLTLPCTVELMADGEERRLLLLLARGVSLDQSYRRWREAQAGFQAALREREQEDEAFWTRAPQLSGDWPATWRRGFVYDQETLRMVIRPPCGLLKGAWDGMQIQAPRLVLAEAALDALALSYAAPELAEEVLLTHFTEAPHSNLPCMREDGSYNMVADDGQICGTAPEWGYPLYCCDLLFRRSGNRAWLRRLYPAAAAYLRWWLEHRRDADGWLVYACSWESGQDVSSRFGPQQTGGTLIQHVRPVDLQASMAQGAAIVTRWATILAQEEVDGSERASSAGPLLSREEWQAEAAWWQRIADEFTVKTRRMWQHGWFRDYDSQRQQWSSERDAMHLAPVFCGAAGWGQSEQLQEALRHPPTHSGGWAPLCWPPVALTVIGAADAAGLPEVAAELAAQFIADGYRHLDRRSFSAEEGLPGVTREYRQARWQGTMLEYVTAGIEGYGWGALGLHLLLRYLLGLREEEAGQLTVQPMLPRALRRPGSRYHAGPIQWGPFALQATCSVGDGDHYHFNLTASERSGSAAHWEWEGRWGESRLIQLSSS
ncbi:MGH1-like glycoside hydrolase domain-containing protein [Thermogemmatispora onikobensis]|uniref:MGH1-like glycoside hydrolase domain-containing protein n=1 Tax=Thermogemmatispora onikobensis TaxID=732234 RepID=UPI000853087D|nr:trehalase family glycosidase [Thermogemmatispora onikobensis]